MRQPPVAIGVAVIAVVLIGLVDYTTGPLWSMSVFYLVPAASVTAVAGRRIGYTIAALSGASGVISDVILQPHYGHRRAAAWNVAVMLVTLLAVVALVDRLRRRALAARDSERQGQQFLAFAAHQLRTPLAAIRSTAEALVVSDGTDADRDELLGGLARESARAGRLVNSLLRVARLDQREPLPRRQANIVDLARAELQRAQATSPGLAWHLEVDTDPIDIMCNPDSLSEAVAALVDNSRRHARTRVTITVRPLVDAVEISVSDDGPGLPPGNDESAFQRFVTLDGRGGSGLGLPIARGIAEAHDGTLTYEGQSFIIRLRAPAPTKATVHHRRSPVSPHP